MKKGFLLDNENKGDENGDNSARNTSNEMGPLKDERSVKVRFLWSGSPSTVKSKPASWGWNTGSTGDGGWGTTKKTTMRTPEKTILDYTLDHELFGQSDSEDFLSDENTTARKTGTLTGKSSGSTTNSTSVVNTRTNPFKNVPLLPHKTLGVPKNALSSWYGKRHKACFVSNSQFRTWGDAAAAHILKWTSEFSCPITGEKFASGRYGDKYVKNKDTSKDSTSKDVTSKDAASKDADGSAKETGTVWFSKKMAAEHAAAARALDCLSLREDHLKGGTGVKVIRLCEEEPYLATREICLKQVGTGLDNASFTNNRNKRRYLDNPALRKVRNQYRQMRVGGVGYNQQSNYFNNSSGYPTNTGSHFGSGTVNTGQFSSSLPYNSSSTPTYGTTHSYGNIVPGTNSVPTFSNNPSLVPSAPTLSYDAKQQTHPQYNSSMTSSMSMSPYQQQSQYAQNNGTGSFVPPPPPPPPPKNPPYNPTPPTGQQPQPQQQWGAPQYGGNNSYNR